MLAEREAAALLALLDGLRERKLLGRAQVVKTGETLVQLGAELVTAEVDMRERAKREDADAEDLVYGAS